VPLSDEMPLKREGVK